MHKYYLIITSLILLTGCKTLDLTLTNPEQFKQLKDTPINISTKVEVNVQTGNDSNKKNRKYLFEEFPVNTYKVLEDSLWIEQTNLTSTIPFSVISKISCRGVYDNEIGFVFENEIIKSYGEPKGSLGTMADGLGGGILGFIGGAALYVKQSLTSMNSNGAFYAIMVGGAFLGGVIGHNIYLRSYINDALIKIKEERAKK